MLEEIVLTINGKKTRIDVDREKILLDLLRNELDLTGTKYGCGEGQCGACTVLIDGRPTRSCITQAASLDGKQVTTIEGLARQNSLHPLQQAFMDAGAMQCGYCIPGMIMSGAGLLQKTPHPTDQEILSAMEGNVCRCGTYSRILTAIRSASASDKAQKGGTR